MPTQEREGASRDWELVRHQPTHSESNRLSVPMYVSSREPIPIFIMDNLKRKLTRSKRRWDSSDPERAPPPLPLNPRSMSPTTKSHVSPNIQAVAAKFTDKPSENAPSSYTTNPMNKSTSPERTLVKGHYHKRMQSLPPADSKGDARSEFMNYLESRSPERPLRATMFNQTSKSQDAIRGPESPSTRQITERELPSYISNRYLSRPILGESTPPSATMLALQNMQLPAEDEPSSPSKPPKMIAATPNEPRSIETPPTQTHTMDTLASQIHSLTDIASNLQREMSNLSRRSKDNATDLVSLKAATNARDEDIRKSLKELTSNLTSKLSNADATRSDLGAFLRPERGVTASESDSSPTSKRSYSVPRMPSPNPYGSDREFAGSPGPISDGSASIALLEKVLREMATKEGEERLIELVDEIKSRPAATASDKDADTKITKMLEEILNLVKEDPSTRAIVQSMRSSEKLHPDALTIETPRPRSLGAMEATSAVRALDVSKGEKNGSALSGGDEILATLRSVKNSVIEGGGMTNGVKALVRELRGEVLGMGRDIARKLETIEASRSKDDQGKSQPPGAQEIASIIDESLSELRQQLAATVNESRQHSSALSEFQSTMNSAAIYSVVNQALKEIELPQPQKDSPGITMEKEEILETVREAWETYKPEIELQNFGLERDEILECLSEGLKSYQPQHEQSITYDQVLEAVQAGLREFQPSQQSSITRDEIILTIRECLERPEPTSRGLDEDHVHHLNSIRDEILGAIAGSMVKPAEKSSDEDHLSHLNNIRDEILNAVTGSMTQSALSKESIDSGLGHDDIVSAISDGLEAHFTAAKEMDEPRISRSDVVNAVNDAFNAQQSALSTSAQPSISREEIIDAIVDGIQIAKPAESSSISRDDILAAIAEGLEKSNETQQSSLSTNVQQPNLTREEVYNAVVEGMESSNTMTREIELNKDDLMDAINAGLQEASHSGNLNVGDQVLGRLQDVVDGMKEEFKQYSAANGKDTEQVLDAIKDGLDVVRREIESYVVTAQDVSGKHEIIDTVKEGFRLLQADMEKTITDASLSNPARGNPDTPELLDAMEKEFEHLRGTLSTLLVRESSAGDKDEILDAIRDLGEHHESQAGDKQALTTIKEEFEKLRERIDLGVVPAEPSSDKEDIIAALREHFDNLRDETRRRDGSESMLSGTSELLDAFNEGIDSIRDDLKTVLDKPADFDSTDIVNTLKEGLAELRLDIDNLRESQKDNAEDDAGTARGDELTLAKDSGSGVDFEALKTMIAQLQEKLEGLDTTPRSAEPTEDALNRGHIDEVMVAIQEVQVALGEVGATRDLHEDAARKEDTDAIQDLILGTKEKIDEMVFPAPDEIATSEQISILETMIREAKDTISDLSTRLEAESPTKSELGALEGLIKDVWMAVDELKGKTKEGEEEENEDNDKLLKSDLQTVEAMIFEVKSQVDELKLPDAETLPTKEEIQELSSLVTEFREKMETNNKMTAQGFEARKVEHGGLADKIEEAKFVIGELGDELKSKLDGSSEGLTELKEILEGLAISAENFSTVDSIKELTELINREFDRARGEEDASKIDKEERDAAAMVKHDETRAAIIVELGAKIDEKIGEVLSKYDDAHSSLHSRFSEAEERDMAHTEAVTSTKALAEEIKLVIGAMGTSVNESCEKIGVDTKTLFEKVDESYDRMAAMQSEVQTQQEQARNDTSRAAAATERVESKLLEFHPQILETVQEILTVVSQHYDHSQKSTEEFRSELSSLPNAIPSMLPALPPPESSRDIDNGLHDKLNDILEHAKNSQVHEVLNTLLEHSKNDQLHEKLDRALDQGSGPNDEIYEKLDQLLDHTANGSGPLHAKLDALLSRPAGSDNAEQSVTQMMKLDEMHRDIMETSRRMNEMFAAQTALVAEDTERKRRAAEDAAVALERRVAQREQVESEMIGLHEEKDSLLKMIHTLKVEKEDLVKQNTKLSKDLSGLETALEIRHEEMQQMEDRADGLEKRILEGVLDHARTVLLSRSNSANSMNLKRNRSTRSSRTGATSPSATSIASISRDSKDPRSLLGNGVGMALKRRVPNNLQAGTTAVQPNIGKERRILSLSHVTGNRGADRQVNPNSGITNLKRSHSVKSNFALRKASWNGRSSVANKENEAFREEDELGSEPESDAGTERKTSYAGTDRKASYAETITDSVVTGPTESVVSDDRRTSGVSIATRSVNAESSIAEEDEVEDRSDHASESDDDAQTAREDDDESEYESDHGPEHQHESEEETERTAEEDEIQDALDRQISETTSAMESEVLNLLAPPSDSALGSETAPVS